MKKLTLLILLLTYCKIFNSVQLSKEDKELYLLFEKGKHYRFENASRFDEKTGKFYPEDIYAYDLFIYNRYPLEFYTKRKDLCKTVSFKKLHKIPVVSDVQLLDFISKNYSRYGESNSFYAASYFNNLKHIYIVEKNYERKTATITEVKLQVDIE